MVQYLTGALGEPAAGRATRTSCCSSLDRFIERNLLEDDPAKRKSIGICLRVRPVPGAGRRPGHAGPRAGHAASCGCSAGRRTPTSSGSTSPSAWSPTSSPEVNERLVQSPHVAAIEVPLPDRRRAASGFMPSAPSAQQASEHRAKAARDVLRAAREAGRAVQRPEPGQPQRAALAGPAARPAASTPAAFRQLKKTLIERQCQGLVEFVEPKHTLDLVVGQAAAKERLQAGRRAAAPRPARRRPDGLPVLRPGRHRQDVPGRVLRRLDRHPLRQAAQLPLEVRRRDRGQPRAGADRAALARAGGRDHRRGRRRAGQPRRPRATRARRAASSR